MYTYLIINFFIVAFPLLFSFESRLEFYKKWKQLFFSALPVSLIFIIWDIWATSRGHWAFNPEYTTGLKIINLPVEEILFFITVPYSCIFLYELVDWYHKKNTLITQEKTIALKSLLSNRRNIVTLCINSIFMLSGIYFFFIEKIEYTGVVLLVIGIENTLSLPRLGQKSFQKWLLLMTGLFFITNLVLTGLPVVSYGSEFITNFRVSTIPIEDFLYNWSLLCLYLYSYKMVKK